MRGSVCSSYYYSGGNYCHIEAVNGYCDLQHDPECTILNIPGQPDTSSLMQQHAAQSNEIREHRRQRKRVMPAEPEPEHAPSELIRSARRSQCPAACCAYRLPPRWLRDKKQCVPSYLRWYMSDMVDILCTPNSLRSEIEPN